MDSAARSVGADDVADAIRRAAEVRDLAVTIVRNGSRGMLWLEPLVEVETERGRVAYGPVTIQDVETLVDEGLFVGADHRLSLGLTEEIPWFARQTRYSFE